MTLTARSKILKVKYYMYIVQVQGMIFMNYKTVEDMSDSQAFSAHNSCPERHISTQTKNVKHYVCSSM